MSSSIFLTKRISSTSSPEYQIECYICQTKWKASPNLFNMPLSVGHEGVNKNKESLNALNRIEIIYVMFPCLKSMNIEVDIRGRSWFIQHSPVEKGDEDSSIIEKVTKTPAHYNNSFNLQKKKINRKTPLSLTFWAQLSQNRAVWQSLPRAKLWSWWGKFPNWSCKSDIWIHGLPRPRCRWGCPRSRAWPAPCRGHTTAGHSHLANNLLRIFHF